MTSYVGNAFYCFADSTSMLLAGIGENISSSRIEVVTGAGLGALWIADAKLIYFSNKSPDTGIGEALKLLGFEYVQKSRPKTEPAPLEELRVDLARFPVVLGPLDMGYLRYIPQSEPGVDHFVLAYAMDEDEIHVHDPGGFPHVSLSLDQLELAWKAERIGYGRDYYQYWTSPRRTHHLTEGQVYDRALECFRSGYQQTDDRAGGQSWMTGHEAILACANHVREGKVAPPGVRHMVGFAFRLGAARALDFAAFFDFRDAALATLKRRQAKLFGRCHTLAVREEWFSLADTLQELAGVEEKFRASLFAC